MDVRYDWDRVPIPAEFPDIEGRWGNRRNPLDFSGVWRFRELLPFAPEDDVLTCPSCGSCNVDEDGDCANCHEPGVGLPPVDDADQHDDDPRKVRGKGVFLANEAINCLMRIPRNDALRARAWEIVRDWLDVNE